MKKKLFRQIDKQTSEKKIPQWERQYFRQKGITAAAVVMVLVVCLLVPAYAENKQNNVGTSTEISADATRKNASDTSDFERNSSDNDGVTDSQANQVDKAETVYVKANADGKARKVMVKDVLKNPGEGKTIEDLSDLKDIKNTEGEEEYTKKGDELIWENKGEDISYEGTTDKELPVKTEIRYFLDGKEIEPEKLAGKSGKVTIRFQYENQTSQTVQVNGKDVETVTPFAVLSTVMLSEDHFSNIQVKNGKLVDMDGQTVVVGYAFPGLQESLKLTDYEATRDVEIPDYVEIQADATDFQLDFTATVVTNGLFKELEEDDLKNLDDLKDSADKFRDASDKLIDGAGQLLGGSEKLQIYIRQYTDGVKAVDQGIGTLQSGAAALKENTAALQSGATAVSDGLEQIVAVLDQSDAIDQITSAGDQIKQYAGGVQQAIDAAQEGLQAVDWNGVEQSAEDKAKEQVTTATRAALANVDGLSEEEKMQIAEQIASQVNLDGVTVKADQQVQAASSILSKVPSLENAGDAFAGLGQISTLANSIRQLSTGSAQLKEGVTAFNNGVGQLSDGIAALRTGSGQLAGSGESLVQGCEALTEGLQALQKGMISFDEEGIQKIADLAGDDLQNVLAQIRALKEADGAYQSFSGLKDGQSGSVRFIIETDEISK